MRIVRIAVMILGLLALLMGILWMGQGIGLIPWPSSSPMISQMQWAYYGIGLGFLGLVVMFLARFIR